MTTIEVGLGDRSYPIWIGHGILGRLGEALKQVDFPRRLALVTDTTVGPLYAETLCRQLEEEGFRVSLVTLPAGEECKTLDTLSLIFDALIEQKFDRTSGLVALGGGVIGDMVGFAAATYLRGIPFAQVPTTLLSQVDSSVGGKTAVNHPLGKNLIGAFYQPRHVHIDVATLETLHRKEFAAGMAEVVKYGVIRDRKFFAWLEEAAARLRDLDPEALVAAVKRSCQIKADIVEIDEKESGLRAILNFGHTFGHAVETLSGYGEVRHGEAVAIGMVVAAEVSRALASCTVQDVEAIRTLLAAFDLPVEPPGFSLVDYLDAMGRDKKIQAGVLRLVLNRGLGDCQIREVEDPAAIFASVLPNLPPK